MQTSLSLFLQTWGGLFYLLNKIFFSRKERTQGETSRRWSIAGWAVYILGMPPWLYILAYEKDWMVALVEAGGLPSMTLGLLIALHHHTSKLEKNEEKALRYLDRFAWAAAILGIALSLWHIGPMRQPSQWAELGVTLGFLIGTYKLAHDHLNGYLWFLLMNASAGILMFMQGYFWLGLQQALSLAFVLDAYAQKKCRNH